MLRGTERFQQRVLTLIGTAVLVCVALTGFAVVVNPFGGRAEDRISVTFLTPYVGQGVEAGTAVVLHGVEVGQVTDVTLSRDGGVRLATDLQKRSVAGLTDTVNIDFRPINYFGVPGVNIVSVPGGQAVRDGSEIRLVPKGNFTLSELLSQLGNVSAAALTPRLIAVVDRVTRYTDAFNPLFETLVSVTTAVADVQRVPTAQLLATTAAVNAAAGPFLNELIIAPARLADFQYYPFHGDPRGVIPVTSPPTSAAASGPKLTPPYMEFATVQNRGLETEERTHNIADRVFELASGGLFASIGKLVSSHPDDLLPLVDGVKALSDPVPSLLRPAHIAQTLAELRSRFEKLFGGNGQQRALRVRLLLDSLPGVAAPLGVQGVLPEIGGSPHDAAVSGEAEGRPGR